MPQNTQKTKIKIKNFSKFHIETFSRSKIYMPNATPNPTRIVIQKLVLLVFQTPIFKKTNNMSNPSQKGGKKNFET
jgi:hypothetical protein